MFSIKTKDAFNKLTNTLFQEIKKGSSLNASRSRVAKDLGFSSINALYASMEEVNDIKYSNKLFNSVHQKLTKELTSVSECDGAYIDVYDEIATFGNEKIVLATTLYFEEGRAEMKQFLTSIDIAEEHEFEDVQTKDGFFKCPRNTIIHGVYEDMPNKDLMLTKKVNEIAEFNKNSLEEIIGKEFKFEFNAYFNSFIFYGKI
jgi:hypothetical protein